MNSKTHVLLKQIDQWYNQASNLAIKVIEQEARHILEQNPQLDEFIMAMGSFFFTSKKQINSSPNNIIDEKDLQPNQSEFYDMVWELNEQFKVTGCPMRFTAKGKLINNW